MSAPEKSQRQVFLEDQDADRRQAPQPEPLPPGEEAGDAGVETQGGPMRHQGVGPGDPHTDRR